MLAEERHNWILEIVQRNKIVKIDEIINQFGISVVTARRDLDKLESKQLVKRIYGGAVQVAAPGSEPLYFARMEENRSQKIAIGRVAADLVEEGDTIYIDIGTTTLELARFLKKYNNLTVLTTSLPIMNELADSNVTVYCLGGKLRPHELSMSGSITAYGLNQFFVQKIFIGAAGITFKEGLSDFNVEEAEVRLKAIERASHSILLADSSKFGVKAFATVCPIELIHTVITDENIPAPYITGLEEHKIELITVKFP